MAKNIEQLIVKYLTNSASAADLDQLSQWIENTSNKGKFNDFVQTHAAINSQMSLDETEKVVEKFLKTIRKEKSLATKLYAAQYYIYAVASTIVVFLLLRISANKEDNMPQVAEPKPSENQILPGNDKAILTLEDGSVEILDKDQKLTTKNASSNGEELIYSQGSPQGKTVYNNLTIPKGGQFRITLSDGTKVWLNSESQLKYPVNFVKGKTREVDLVYGEAYFDVTPSTDHEGAGFKVVNRGQTIQVLGTEFNIKAYKEEPRLFTTLVKGKVMVNTAVGKEVLLPNQQLILNEEDHSKVVSEVDVYREIAWKDGVFSFKNKPLKEIMVVLSRWYDIQVYFENPEVENKVFNGNLNKKLALTDILETLTYPNDITIEIHGKTVILK